MLPLGLPPHLFELDFDTKISFFTSFTISKWIKKYYFGVPSNVFFSTLKQQKIAYTSLNLLCLFFCKSRFASFLGCSLYIYRSSNKCRINKCRFLLFLEVLAKRCSLYFAIAFKSDCWKSDNYIERVIKQRRLRALNLKGAIEKSPTLLSQYWSTE